MMLSISEKNFDSIISYSCNSNDDTCPPFVNPTINHELMSVDNHELSSINDHEVDCYCSSLMRYLEFQLHLHNHEEDCYCSSLMSFLEFQLSIDIHEEDCYCSSLVSHMGF